MNDNQNFKVGDVVTLKSGSPEMTVSYIGKDGKVSCTWFDYAGAKFSHAEFHPPQLVKAEDA